MKKLGKKFAKKVNIAVRIDSTAGKSVATRFGASKQTKHFLYLQDLVMRGLLKLKKVGIKVNRANPLTKNLFGDILSSYIGRLCVAFCFQTVTPH